MKRRLVALGVVCCATSCIASDFAANLARQRVQQCIEKSGSAPAAQQACIELTLKALGPFGNGQYEVRPLMAPSYLVPMNSFADGQGSSAEAALSELLTLRKRTERQDALIKLLESKVKALEAKIQALTATTERQSQ